MHLRHPSHRLGIKPVFSHDPKSACSFSDQHGAIGEERDRPRLLEMIRHYLYAQLSLFRRLEIDTSTGELGC